MPKLIADDEMVSAIAGTSFQYSGVRPDQLGATEYTLASLVVDATGSVTPFRDDLLNMVRTVAQACQKHPRAENIMLRYTTFNSSQGVQEEHGFRPVPQIDPTAYTPLRPHGMTPLADAMLEALGATLDYGTTLGKVDFGVNAILFVVTDGMDNASTHLIGEVGERIARIRRSEEVESLTTLLIGINTQDVDCRTAMADFQRKVGFDQFVEVREATPGHLAKLAGFISESVSSISQALGTGGASQPITF